MSNDTALLRPARNGRPALPAPNGKPLTPDMVEVLQARADAAAHKQVAKRLHYSESQVDYLLRCATRRLGARNTTHAVVVAWFMGIIH